MKTAVRFRYLNFSFCVTFMDLPTTKMVVSKRWKVFHKTSFNFGTVTGNEIKTESNREKDATSWSTFFLIIFRDCCLPTKFRTACQNLHLPVVT